MVELRDKIVLKEKQTIEIPMHDLVATLRWKKAVDLDLWCIYKDSKGKTGQIGFNGRGSLDREPFIQLDQDSGVGDSGGDNE